MYLHSSQIPKIITRIADNFRCDLITNIIFLFLPILLAEKPVNAQIIPDQTLGKENSVINSIDQLKKQIEGGAIRGENLFHSFQEFNIGENQSVYFTNPAGIENILTRIREKKVLGYFLIFNSVAVKTFL